MGYNQILGLDFLDTFSPVVKPTTVRIILTIAVTKYWKIRHPDINNAFLNGHLEEEIYMQQPPDFEERDGKGLVCKLTKTLYGLKQASRAWFLRLKQVLKRLGFYGSRADHSLFFKFQGPHSIFLLVYVDDILITRSDDHQVYQTVLQLNQAFAL